MGTAFSASASLTEVLAQRAHEVHILSSCEARIVITVGRAYHLHATKLDVREVEAMASPMKHAYPLLTYPSSFKSNPEDIDDLGSFPESSSPNTFLVIHNSLVKLQKSL